MQITTKHIHSVTLKKKKVQDVLRESIIICIPPRCINQEDILVAFGLQYVDDDFVLALIVVGGGTIGGWPTPL
jgi:hypothetical protein